MRTIATPTACGRPSAIHVVCDRTPFPGLQRIGTGLGSGLHGNRPTDRLRCRSSETGIRASADVGFFESWRSFRLSRSPCAVRTIVRQTLADACPVGSIGVFLATDRRTALTIRQTHASADPWMRGHVSLVSRFARLQRQSSSDCGRLLRSHRFEVPQNAYRTN